MKKWLVLAVMSVVPLAVAACAASPSTPGRTEATGTPGARDLPKGASIEEQASWLKGSPAKVEEIVGAEAWLRSPGLEAYREASGTELIYDRARNRVLTWEPGVRTVSETSDSYRPEGYGLAVGAAAAKADGHARAEYKGELGTMRRVVQFPDYGNGPEFSFSYDRYVDGIRVADHVTVNSSGEDGSALFVAHFTKPSDAAKGYVVKTDLPVAVDAAAKAAKLEKWRLLAADLYLTPPMGSEKGSVLWAITLEDTGSPSEGGATRLVTVDPATGEVVGVEGGAGSGEATPAG